MTVMTEIYVLDKKVRLLQPEGGFRTSLDSVMLAAAVSAKAGQTVLDMGCGVGGASFCLLWRVEARLTGIDINEEYVALAQKNNELNGKAADFTAADIRHFDSPTFDHVMLNPPFFEAGAHLSSPDPGKAQANGHVDEDLSIRDWIKAAHRLVKSNGTMTIIYPGGGIDKILQSMGKSFGAIEIIPLWQREGAEAKRVIIRAIKDRQTPARILPGLILHQKDGSYTMEADSVLRSGNKI
ncbi:MAG: methyltransferase [Micavibrio aeruginosavorus]|uniref:Methyltransferase n=1 Tax=Micavibrio aeruginosavorus TaxID=349221 RepID=A0A2W5FSZ2_9BACT|nr:MAG: methyltransferase [Micavibrio aeruginosavorus]